MEREQTKKRVKYSLIALVVVIILSYAGYQAQKIVQGPKIIIESPINGTTVNQDLIEVKGVAQNIKKIQLNSREILQDESGNFKEKLLLSYGYNSLKIEGWDKFGRKTEKIIEMIYK